jgi:HEAT repeat protein
VTAERQAGRILELVALADETSEAADLASYLDDPDPAVRWTAIEILTESAPADAGPALARALGDGDPRVRAAAVESLRELREVIVADTGFHGAIAGAAGSADPAVRAAVTRLLREHRLGLASDFWRAAADDDADVRREAVAGLVWLNATEAVAGLARDAEPLVRLAVARGLATIGNPAGLPTLEQQAADPDVRVRAAALEAIGAIGCPPDSVPLAIGSLFDPAWEVRKGGAIALGGAAPALAVEPLLAALDDENLDVRKAAVQSLSQWVGARGEVRQALMAVLDDPDADVRGYARLALD